MLDFVAAAEGLDYCNDAGEAVVGEDRAGAMGGERESLRLWNHMIENNINEEMFQSWISLCSNFN